MSIDEASREVTQQLGLRARILGYFCNSAKAAAAIGALIAGIAQFFDDSWIQLVGAVGAIVTFISAIILLASEKDSSLALAAARNAMDIAKRQEQEHAKLVKERAEREAIYFAEVTRFSHFQSARDFARQGFEEVINSTEVLTESDVIGRLFTQADRFLKLSLGLQTGDIYSVCVHARQINAQTSIPELHCVAHIRAIDCPFNKARIWPQNIGVAGTAMSLRRPLFEADMTLPGIKARYGLSAFDTAYDGQCRSIYSCPVWGGNQADPWGMLTITTNKPGHFREDDITYGNVANSLAGMISLAVSIVRAKKDGKFSPSMAT